MIEEGDLSSLARSSPQGHGQTQTKACISLALAYLRVTKELKYNRNYTIILTIGAPRAEGAPESFALVNTRW